MFSPEQNALLDAKLSASNVKTRLQSGRSLSYIESWVAIAEANRIFGFGGWSRETVELRAVSEREREIGQQKTPGWSVTYIARVRVTVYGEDGKQVVREGSGSGHGIDRDLGQAHESALKEAESDAGKRALMTFGNPFGLALYDKEQAGVEAAPPAPRQAPKSEPTAAPAKAPAKSYTPENQAPVATPEAPKAKITPAEWVAEQMTAIAAAKAPKDLMAWEQKNEKAILSLNSNHPDLHRQLLDYLMKQYDVVNPIGGG